MNLLRLRRTQSGRGMALCLSASLALSFGGCTTHEVSIPDLDGPSEQGFSIRLSLSKDVLVADGRDFAVVTATVRGPDGRPAQNQDVFFAIADESGRFADIGVIVGSNGPGTGATVRTNAQGVAQVLYEAPPRTDATANQSVLVLARLVGSDFNGATYHSVRIELRSAEPRLFPANPNNAPPLCSFITEPNVGPFRRGQVIGFHSTSVDTDGVIIRYEWNFGDGTTGDSPDTAKVYGAAGSYTVTHSVIDDDGGRASCFTAGGIVVQ
jgi:PKD domain-containing protein